MTLSILGLELLGQAKVEEFGDFFVARAFAGYVGAIVSVVLLLLRVLMIAALTLGMIPPVKSNVVWLDIPKYDVTLVVQIS